MRAFNNYRRNTARAEAQLIETRLLEAVDISDVFRDTTIKCGEKWPQRFEAALASANVVLVLLAPDWVTYPFPNGRCRIDAPDDWVRREIEEALPRDGLSRASYTPAAIRDRS